jgi:hypothetical protein
MVEESAIAKRSQHVIETASRGYAGVLFSEEPKLDSAPEPQVPAPVLAQQRSQNEPNAPGEAVLAASAAAGSSTGAPKNSLDRSTKP